MSYRDLAIHLQIALWFVYLFHLEWNEMVKCSIYQCASKIGREGKHPMVL